jgi:hypothetical protein
MALSTGGQAAPGAGGVRHPARIQRPPKDQAP